MHAVETANLNVETLKVMKSASNAMKVIHGGMNVDKVDETMYVPYFPCYTSMDGIPKLASWVEGGKNDWSIKLRRGEYCLRVEKTLVVLFLRTE